MWAYWIWWARSNRRIPLIKLDPAFHSQGLYLTLSLFVLSLNMENLPHPELQTLKARLQQIYDATLTFKPLTVRPPILDSSYENGSEDADDNQWLRQENIPGLKKLGESIKIDLGVLEKVTWNFFTRYLGNWFIWKISFSSSSTILDVPTSHHFLQMLHTL